MAARWKAGIFKEQVIECMKQAVQEDKIKVAIKSKLTEYLHGAEEICIVLNGGGGGPPGAPNGSDAAITTLPKSRCKDGEDDSKMSNPSSVDSSLALDLWYHAHPETALCL